MIQFLCRMIAFHLQWPNRVNAFSSLELSSLHVRPFELRLSILHIRVKTPTSTHGHTIACLVWMGAGVPLQRACIDIHPL